VGKKFEDRVLSLVRDTPVGRQAVLRLRPMSFRSTKTLVDRGPLQAALDLSTLR
jgi:hypothetical protein